MALILVVDDSPMIQKAAKALLTKQGHDVRVAGMAKSALTRIDSEPFDLIVMDLNLPDLSGTQAIEYLRRHFKVQIPIIVLSGEIKTEVMLKLKPLGVAAFVAKSEDFMVRLIDEVNLALAPPESDQ